MYGRNRRSPSPPQRGGGGGGGRYQILIKNLPFDVDWKKLKDFIKDTAKVEPKFAQVVEIKPGRSAGFGFAAFHTIGDMDTALSRMRRQQLMGREVFVMEDSGERELDRLKEQKGILDSRGGGGPRDSGPRGGRSSTGGVATLMGTPVSSIPGLNTLDSETLESLGNGEMSNKIFAYNLVYDVNERKLRDVFNMIAPVEELKIPKKGHAIIEYRHQSEALRALLVLRNQFLDGRKLMIKMDGAPFAKSTDNSRPPADRLEDRKRPRLEEPRHHHHHQAPPPPNPYRQMDNTNYPPPSAGPPVPTATYSAPGRKVCIEGLPLSVTTALIRNLFESVGAVDYVQLSDGGRCDLEYFDGRHIATALSRFDGYMMEGRPIKVYAG